MVIFPIAIFSLADLRLVIKVTFITELKKITRLKFSYIIWILQKHIKVL